MLTDKLKSFSSFHLHDRSYDRKLGAYCVGDDIRHSSRRLLNHDCPICLRAFTQFELLRDHTRKAHERFYCDLCVEHLTLFSHEKKLYTRPELARHKRVGDEDDTSHRGHPICRFCDERYFDNDELLVHLRRNHFFCHLCDKDGRQDYYVSYEDLMQHCREEHFVCEQGNCAGEKFTNVFRSELDLQVHEMKFHKKGKFARVLPVEVTYISGRESVITVEDYDDISQIRQSSITTSHRRPPQRNSQGAARQFDTRSAQPQETKQRLNEKPPSTVRDLDASKRQKRNKEKPLNRRGRDKKQTVEVNQSQQPKVKPPPGFTDQLPPAEPAKETRLGADDFPELPSVSSHQANALPLQWNSRVLLKDDFPVLASNKDLAQRDPSVVLPPGFSRTTKKQGHPPPGLTIGSKKPPPGLSHLSRKSEPTGTQSADRSEALGTSILEILGNDATKFSRFRSISAQFWNGLLSSDDYYDACVSLVGQKGFEKVFPELVASLPDSEKQQKLLHTHSRVTGTVPFDGHSKPGGWVSKGKKYSDEFPALSTVVQSRVQ